MTERDQQTTDEGQKESWWWGPYLIGFLHGSFLLMAIHVLLERLNR